MSLLALWCRGQRTSYRSKLSYHTGTQIQTGQQAPLFPEHLSSPVALFLLIHEDCAVDTDGHLAPKSSEKTKAKVWFPG